MRRLFLLLLATMMLGLGCSSGDEGGSAEDPGSPPAAESDTDAGADTDLGSCNVTVTGDAELAIEKPAEPVPASSDYWLSEDEMRNDTLDLVDDVDERIAAGQQVVVLLQVSCGDPTGAASVLLNTTDSTTRSDLPQGPGTYQLLDSLASPEPGIAAGLTTDDPFNWQTLNGSIEITVWDDSHVAGAFEFEAEQAIGFVEDGAEQLTATVKGTFDLPCQIGDNCSS